MENNTMAIVLAAGKGTRMKSKNLNLFKKLWKRGSKKSSRKCRKSWRRRNCSSCWIYERRGYGSFRR